MSQFMIHLPLKDGGFTQVLINPDKRYGNKLGSELIKTYRGKERKPKEDENIVINPRDPILFIPHGNIGDKVIIGNKTLNSIDFFNSIERQTGLKIICKTDNKCLRAVKTYQNVSLRLPNFKGF
jgi:hypothetical protein